MARELDYHRADSATSAGDEDRLARLKARLLQALARGQSGCHDRRSLREREIARFAGDKLGPPADMLGVGATADATAQQKAVDLVTDRERCDASSNRVDDASHVATKGDRERTSGQRALASLVVGWVEGDGVDTNADLAGLRFRPRWLGQEEMLRRPEGGQDNRPHGGSPL
jgi:hypothetical protein